MDRLLDNKFSSNMIGFGQAIGLIAYISIVASVMQAISQSGIEPGYLGTVFFLTLFVFSAGITGSLVFGLPALYALKGKPNKAIEILAFTFLYIFITGIITLIIILVNNSQTV